MNKSSFRLIVSFVIVIGCMAALAGFPSVRLYASLMSLDTNPPAQPVKLIFIHHSTGGNWLADPNGDQPYGGLGRALMENNYFVSATNYGWGPDGIGDRTDIPNWPEWFTGPNSGAILSALYKESGQNIGDFGAWSRLPADPGGENQIIMFKSCFPNSDLYGSPFEPPLPEPNDEYTIENAKAVYNTILTYFATRQDKLFIIITAPPLMQGETSPERAVNAREFNYWLVNDWLRDYPYNNVAVFDYFNVLTGEHNHHWWNGQQIESVQATDNNYAAYPSGDSHPSTAGQQKATAEFVPLLNVFYNRWKAGAPIQPVTEGTPVIADQPTVPPPTQESGGPPPAMPSGSTIDDFESGSDFYPYGDNSTFEAELDSQMAHGGANSLRIRYSINPGGTGGSGHFFDPSQDWSVASGISFWLRADAADQPLMLLVFSGNPDSPTPFEARFQTTAQSAAGWTQFTFAWTDFVRAGWADESGLSQLDPARITSYTFNFENGESGQMAGTLWVDDVALVTGGAPPAAATPKPASGDAPTKPPQPGGGEKPASGPCPASTFALPLGVVAVLLARRNMPGRRG